MLLPCASSGFGFDPTTECSLPQRIPFANQRSAFSKLRTASFAQHSLPFLRVAVSHGFVFAVKSPAHFSGFHNFNCILGCHARKIPRPRV